jgi:hypothetical protein
VNDGTIYEWNQSRRRAGKHARLPDGVDSFVSPPDGYDITQEDKFVLRSGQPTEQVDDGNLEAQ